MLSTHQEFEQKVKSLKSVAFNNVNMEEHMLELMEVNMQLKAERDDMENQNKHLRSLLSQMQQLQLQQTPKKKRQSPKWLYFREKKADPDLLEMLSKRHNLAIDDIPWQLIKRETDKLYESKNVA